MGSTAQRGELLMWINEACRASVRLHRACALIGLAARTVQRWMALALFAADGLGPSALYVDDGRTPEQRMHNRPSNKLSDDEREAALGLLNSARYKDLPPSQIVPPLG